MLLVSIVFVTYESVTGMNIAEIMTANVAQDMTTGVNIIMMSPRGASGIVNCPKGYDVEINNGRVTVHIDKLYRKATVTAYYVVPDGVELPQDVYAVCTGDNFLRVEKWQDEDGKQHLSIAETDDLGYTAMPQEEPPEQEEIEI
jgi:hypothetical protein